MEAAEPRLEVTAAQAVDRLTGGGGLFSAREMADALGVTPRTIGWWRTEGAHPQRETRRRLAELLDLDRHLLKTFGERAASRSWLEAPSRYLGGLSPIEVVRAGRFDRVATVTPLRPRSRPQPERYEEAAPATLAAEEGHRYETRPEPETADPDRAEAEALVDAILDGADFSQLPPEHRGDAADPTRVRDTLPANSQQPEATNGSEDTVPARSPTPEAPNLYDAALSLHACLPDGQKVSKDTLVADAARDLGYPKLTRQVKTAFNKALNAEHNAGRLKTDWQRVWKSKKK